MASHGIKALCLENWMIPDPLMGNLVMFSNDGGMASSMSGHDWASTILEHNLAERVPNEIFQLFEVARGSMLYGYFFYPLYTLAFEQLTRVAEAAVSEKCKQIGICKSIKTFDKKLKYLQCNNVLSDVKKAQWDSLRKLRNIASHPDQPTILPPGPIVGMVAITVGLINELFT